MYVLECAMIINCWPSSSVVLVHFRNLENGMLHDAKMMELTFLSITKIVMVNSIEIINWRCSLGMSLFKMLSVPKTP